MLTHDEIIKLAIKGTTCKPKDLKVFYADERFAIVKHNGSSIYYSTGPEWVPAWVVVYFIDLLQKKNCGAGIGKTIETGKKRLTEKILPELLEKAEQVYAKFLKEQEEVEEEEEEVEEEDEFFPETSFDWDMDKLEQLYLLTDIPCNAGEQFINIDLRLSKNLNYGEISYGFNWKKEMGQLTFSNLDEAIAKVEELIQHYKPTMERDT